MRWPTSEKRPGHEVAGECGCWSMSGNDDTRPQSLSEPCNRPRKASDPAFSTLVWLAIAPMPPLTASASVRRPLAAPVVPANSFAASASAAPAPCCTVSASQFPIEPAEPGAPIPRLPCMGFFCQWAFRTFYFSSPSFFVRFERPFLRPDPLFSDAVERRGCQGRALRAPARAWPCQVRARAARSCGRDDEVEGSSLSGTIGSHRNLVFGGPRDPNHDAAMRIGAKLRSGGPILPCGIESHGNCGGFRHLEPSTATHRKCADGAETVRCFDQSPFNAPAAGPHRPARRRLAPAATRRSTACAQVPRPWSSDSRWRSRCGLDTSLANALSFWNMRKRHASWTTAPPYSCVAGSAGPFSRRLAPLSSGDLR